jgi:hypothetical protein
MTRLVDFRFAIRRSEPRPRNVVLLRVQPVTAAGDVSRV